MSDLDGYDRESQNHDEYHLADRPEMGQQLDVLCAAWKQHVSCLQIFLDTVEDPQGFISVGRPYH